MKSILRDLWETILFFIPHFVTEDVAVLRRADGDLDIVCSMDALDPDDVFDGVARVKCFTWFGMGWTYRLTDTKIRSWPIV